MGLVFETREDITSYDYDEYKEDKLFALAIPYSDTNKLPCGLMLSENHNEVFNNNI